MGNWRTVQIEGRCASKDVSALKTYLAVERTDPRWGSLHNGGMAGLPNWAKEQIDVSGNLGERDYTPDDVRDELLKLSAIAPSLSVTVHCGADYEDDTCIASVHLENGQVHVGKPKIEYVSGPSHEQMMETLKEQMMETLKEQMKR